MRPDVPAPTYTIRPPRCSAGTASSTAVAIARRAPRTAAAAASCPSYMAAIISGVDHESRSMKRGLMSSVRMTLSRLCRKLGIRLYFNTSARPLTFHDGTLGKMQGAIHRITFNRDQPTLDVRREPRLHRRCESAEQGDTRCAALE